jgi:hypothetical protein
MTQEEWRVAAQQIQDLRDNMAKKIRERNSESASDAVVDMAMRVRKSTLQELKRYLEDCDIDRSDHSVSFEYKDGWNDSLNSVLDIIDKIILECD